MVKRPIYLDYNATTPIDPKVYEEMLPFLREEFGNPSSGHFFGRSPKEEIFKARERVASLINASSDEIIFTSGGTESNNMVLKGVVRACDTRSVHVITSAIEHPSVLNPVLYMSELGVEVTVVRVDGFAMVDPEDIKKAIRRETRLVSIMLANNEVGTIQPISEIAKICKEHGILLHTDAAQAVGKIEVDVRQLGVDYLTIAGHKLYAPKGIGALFVRDGVELQPLLHGASQERGMRPGTENVAFSVALGKAAQICQECLRDKEHLLIKELRDMLEQGIREIVPNLVINGHPEHRLPNTSSISIPGRLGAEVLKLVEEVFVASTGAACHDRSQGISHVLSAMGLARDVAMGTMRLSLGRFTTRPEIETAIDAIRQALLK